MILKQLSNLSLLKNIEKDLINQLKAKDINDKFTIKES